MREFTLHPDPSLLLESMRSIGYTAAAATADLIDNSIAAGSTRMHIRFNPGKPDAVAFLDDGCGMDREGLLQAMKHGSRSPNESRESSDLGRFGLGLKTASMSQCRRLTVIARVQGGSPCGMVWDLDRVIESKDWTCAELEPDELKLTPHYSEWESFPHGTMVVWQKLDRIAADDKGDGSEFASRMNDVREHVRRVFHRYIDGEEASLNIDINNHEVDSVDPFLKDEGAEASPRESLEVDGHSIDLRAFTLPHISRLTRAQIEKAGGEKGLRREQGFYIYRNKRLIIGGTWFGLQRQEELTKLTRIRVDLPNSLDHQWSLDIKKSAAAPPASIRDRLRQLAEKMSESSRKAITYRGRVARADIAPIWNRIEDRTGPKFEINKEHPIIDAFRMSIADWQRGEFLNVLRGISAGLPIEAIYNDRAGDRIGTKENSGTPMLSEEQLEVLARQMLAPHSEDVRSHLVAHLGLISPFHMYPDLIPGLMNRLQRQ